MRRSGLWLVVSVLVASGWPLGAQPTGTDPMRQQVADLVQDVAGLRQQVAQMRLELEQLQRDNAALRATTAQQANALGSSMVTMTQLNDGLGRLRTELTAALNTSRTELAAQVTRQIEALAQQTQSAMTELTTQINRRGSSGGGGTATTAPARTFSDDFPKEGVTYTIQRGDTLASIAQKHNARMADIVNANKIENPDRVVPGQTLFIPQRRP